MFYTTPSSSSYARASRIPGSGSLLTSCMARLFNLFILFSLFCSKAAASPIVARGLEARGKKEGASWSTPISGVPAWGWILIGVAIGMLVAWGASYAYWHKPTGKGVSSSSRVAATMPGGYY